MTGNAVEYFKALAKCWFPLLTSRREAVRRDRRYSVRHWRSRIALGTAIIMGTIKSFPQARFGLEVADSPSVKNMQKLI